MEEPRIEVTPESTIEANRAASADNLILTPEELKKVSDKVHPDLQDRLFVDNQKPAFDKNGVLLDKEVPLVKESESTSPAGADLMASISPELDEVLNKGGDPMALNISPHSLLEGIMNYTDPNHPKG
jgi:hypothetical protein